MVVFLLVETGVYWYSDYMNYYLVQSKFFIIFIAISAMAFSAIPFVRNSFADVSDTYVRSQLDRLQSEMLLIKSKQENFKGSCTTGNVNGIVIDLIKNDVSKMICKTNSPIYSKMMTCAQLKNRNYYCVDSSGVICEVAGAIQNGYACKEIG